MLVCCADEDVELTAEEIAQHRPGDRRLGQRDGRPAGFDLEGKRRCAW